MADAKAQKRAKFEAVFPILREELLAYLKQEGMPSDAITWFQRVSPICCLHRPPLFNQDGDTDICAIES